MFETRPNRRIGIPTRELKRRRQIFDFVYSIFQKNNASFSLRALSSASPPPSPSCSVAALSTPKVEEERWRKGTTEERNKLDRREGGGCRFGYGFRKRRRILFLRKPDKRPFTRVFLAHASRGQRDREGFSIAGKQISARQISVSLSRDKRSPRVPRIFHSLSLSLLFS